MIILFQSGDNRNRTIACARAAALMSIIESYCTVAPYRSCFYGHEARGYRWTHFKMVKLFFSGVVCQPSWSGLPLPSRFHTRASNQPLCRFPHDVKLLVL